MRYDSVVCERIQFQPQRGVTFSQRYHPAGAKMHILANLQLRCDPAGAAFDYKPILSYTTRYDL